MCNFKIGTLNINGARNDVKRASVYSLINVKRLDVTFIQETHSTVDNEGDWRREWNGQVYFSHKSSNSGGVGVLFSRDFNPVSVDVEDIMAGHILKINAEFERVKMVFVCVYAPSAGTERLIFLNILDGVIQRCSREEFLVIGGDFNCTVNPILDRNHSEPHAASQKQLKKSIETHELSDVWRNFNSNTRQYTWLHSRDGLLSMSRLDRFYCFKHHLSIFRSSEIMPVGFTDHQLVECCIFINNVKCRSAYWHFNTALLSDNGFSKAFTVFWNDFRMTKSSFNSLQQWWDIGKSQIKSLCLQYTLNVSRDLARSIRDLEREMVELQELADSTGERGHVEVFKAKKRMLADLLGVPARGAVVRSRFQHVAMMDAPSHFFFGLERKNGQRRLMHSLLSSDGQLLQETAAIRKYATSFYEDLFNCEYTEKPDELLSFLGGLPQVSAEANKCLEADISQGELLEALQSLRPGKAPGIDGLPADFYKAFWSVLGGDLLDVLRDSLLKGRLPLSCRRAVLTLLPKNGDLRNLKNWRPVALLCTDYKLLSKVLANRVRKVMEQLIHVDQTYCVPGRLITDNVHLIRDVLNLSSSLGTKLGLVSLDQEKAFDRVEHHYLWQTLKGFGFSSGLIAKIQALYGDVESVLKINGGLSAPFKVKRGVRQGCPLSGMLYSLAIEPLLHKLRHGLSGFNIPNGSSVFKLSAYADDLILAVQNQTDVNFLTTTVQSFGEVSSAKVNWSKSEALRVGNELQEVKLPGGLTWKEGGLKYLGVHLGDPDTVKKNWDNVLEKVEGRLRQWRWIFPKMSFRGRVLIINNLAASMLWHRLSCVDPPQTLLAKIQAIIVDCFWDRLHWVPQSVLFLPREEGGQGLVHLAGRGAAFRLQFIQRLLTGPTDLVWRSVARAVMAQGWGLGLQESLFLMDFRRQNLATFPEFYQSLFRTWGLFKKERIRSGSSLFWILKEPIVFGTRFDVSRTMGPSVAQKFLAARVTLLGQVMDLCGPHLEDAAALCAAVGVTSVRLIRNMLGVWRNQLSTDELLIASQSNSPAISDSEPFPVESLALDFKDCTGWFLKHGVSDLIPLSTSTGKTMYRVLVKTLNKEKLKGRADTPWRAHLGLDPGVEPSWRALYKPPLTKRVGDLQWRVLHGAVAVNGFVSVLNPNVDDKCPFCPLRETVFHCFLDCSRLQALFVFLQRLFCMFGVVFNKHMFILGFKYSQKRKAKCQLLNFLLGQAKMAVYLSRKRKLEGSWDCDVNIIFIRMIKSRLTIDFNYYSLMKDLGSFEKVWCVSNGLCAVKEEKLLFGSILG